jgi:hypothetical protein
MTLFLYSKISLKHLIYHIATYEYLLVKRVDFWALVVVHN